MGSSGQSNMQQVNLSAGHSWTIIIFVFCVKVRLVIALKMSKPVLFLTRMKTMCTVLQTKKQDCSREGQQQKEMGNVKE